MERLGESREMVFCYECQNEWYRAEYGLTCPECDSEFTEIIEQNHDPRNFVVDRDDVGNEDTRGSNGPAPFQSWTADDQSWTTDNQPDFEQHLDQHLRQHQQHQQQHSQQQNLPGHYHYTRSGPNFRMETTIHTSGGTTHIGGGNAGSLGPIPALLGGMARAVFGVGAPPTEQQAGARSGSPFGNVRVEARQEGSRFTYDPNARLQPRDPNNPGSSVNQVDPIQQMFANILSAHNAPPHVAFAHHGGSLPPNAPSEHPNQPPPIAMNLTNLLSELITQNLGGMHHHFGDVAYSQEDMDRIISRLMEQTATSNAPGPASAAAIASLPKRAVDEKMLGESGRAECSICMDEVVRGEMVTVLPCTHWFHDACVGAWLAEHDTCPHCRKGIEPRDGDGQGANSSTRAQPSQQQQHQSSHAYRQSSSPHPPGGWDSPSPTSPSSPSSASFSMNQSARSGSGSGTARRGGGHWRRSRRPSGGNSRRTSDSVIAAEAARSERTQSRPGGTSRHGSSSDGGGGTNSTSGGAGRDGEGAGVRERVSRYLGM